MFTNKHSPAKYLYTYAFIVYHDDNLNACHVQFHDLRNTMHLTMDRR